MTAGDGFEGDAVAELSEVVNESAGLAGFALWFEAFGFHRRDREIAEWPAHVRADGPERPQRRP